MLRKGSLLKGKIIDDNNHYLQLTDQRMSGCLSQDVWCWSDRRQPLVYSPPCAGLFLVAQSCPTLWDPVNCSPPDSSDHGDSPSKNTGVGCHSFLQRIFPTKGSNPYHPHCRKSLSSEPPVKPNNTGVSSLSLLQGILLTQESTQDLLHCRQILYCLSHQRSI